MDRAAVLAGVDPDYGIKDLYNAIEGGNFVSPHHLRSVCVLAMVVVVGNSGFLVQCMTLPGFTT